MRCISCRNWCRTCLVGRTPAQLQTELEADDLKFREYHISISAFEDHWNTTSGYVKGAKDVIPIPQFINIIEEEGVEDRVNLGVFWPKDVFLVEETSSFPEGIATYYTVGGKRTLGVWRDKKHGEPPGTVTKSTVSAKRSQSLKQVGSHLTSSSAEMRRAHAASSSFIAGFQSRTVQDEGGSTHVEFTDAGSKEAGSKLIEDSDSDNEWARLKPKVMLVSQLPDQQSGNVPGKRKRATESISSASDPKKSKKSVAGPATGVKAPRAASARVYPSEQNRLISGLSEAIGQAQVVIDGLCSEAGLNTTTPEKLNALLTKLDGKLTDILVEKLTCNTDGSLCNGNGKQGPKRHNWQPTIPK
jgi:hypothetical protein